MTKPAEREHIHTLMEHAMLDSGFRINNTVKDERLGLMEKYTKDSIKLDASTEGEYFDSLIKVTMMVSSVPTKSTEKVFFV